MARQAKLDAKGRRYTGRYSGDDRVRRWIWNTFAVIGIICVLLTVAAAAGLVAVFNGQ